MSLHSSKHGTDALENEAGKSSSSTDLDGKTLFNRELSWLEFNSRVLEEAMDESRPVLERLKFLSIFSTNLDEFFMIRVSGLKEQVAEGVGEFSVDGMSASEQLSEIYERVRPLIKTQAAYLRDNVLPRLAKESITIHPYASLDAADRK